MMLPNDAVGLNEKIISDGFENGLFTRLHRIVTVDTGLTCGVTVDKTEYATARGAGGKLPVAKPIISRNGVAGTTNWGVDVTPGKIKPPGFA